LWAFIAATARTFLVDRRIARRNFFEALFLALLPFANRQKLHVSMSLRNAIAGATAAIPIFPVGELAVLISSAIVQAVTEFVFFLQARHRAATVVVSLSHATMPPAIGGCASRGAFRPHAPGGPLAVHTITTGLSIAGDHLQLVGGFAECPSSTRSHLYNASSALETPTAGAGAATPVIPGGPLAIADGTRLILAVFHLFQRSHAALSSILSGFVDVASSDCDTDATVL